MFKIVVTRRAQKDIDILPVDKQDKVRAVIGHLAYDPFVGKKLTGNYSGLYSVRVWPYRIIYRIDKGILSVVIMNVKHRQSAYRN